MKKEAYQYQSPQGYRLPHPQTELERNNSNCPKRHKLAGDGKDLE